MAWGSFYYGQTFWADVPIEVGVEEVSVPVLTQVEDDEAEFFGDGQPVLIAPLTGVAFVAELACTWPSRLVRGPAPKQDPQPEPVRKGIEPPIEAVPLVQTVTVSTEKAPRLFAANLHIALEEVSAGCSARKSTDWTMLAACADEFLEAGVSVAQAEELAALGIY